MRAAAAAASIAAGCGGHHWINYACDLSTAPHHDAIAFVAGKDNHLELRRDDGTYRLDPPRCAGDGSHTHGIVALADGWRALIWGYTTDGNFFESGDTEDEFACIVDFRTGSTEEVGPYVLAHDLRQFMPTVGTHTGWLYDHQLGGPITVIDLAKHRNTRLAPPVEHQELTETAIVELDGVIRTVTGQLEQIDPVHPIYKGTLIVRDYDPAQWPPAPGEARAIAVGGRTDSITLSADGRWAAYDGRPYYVGMESQGPVADLGLVDVMAGTIAFEKLHVPGDVTVQDLVLDGDRPWTLVTTDPDVPNAHVTTARWLDPTGAYAAASRHVADDYNVNLAWMPSRKQIAADVSCDVDLLDLPPPVK